MRFRDIYGYANSLGADAPVSMRGLADHVVAFHEIVGEVNFYPVELDEKISLGHIKFERDRSSPYEEEFTVANIRFARSLNRCWRRLVCCKELMHVFDSNEEKVNTRERFFKLMEELSSPPMAQDASPMFRSENRAQWMAVLCLCPERLRNIYKPAIDEGRLTHYDVALKLKVPQQIIPSIAGRYYDTALQSLINL